MAGTGARSETRWGRRGRRSGYCGLEVRFGGGIDLLRGDGFDPVAVEEVQPPIAERRPFAEFQPEPLRVGCGELAFLEDLAAGAIDLFGGDGVFLQSLDDVNHGLADLVERLVGTHLGEDEQGPRVVGGEVLTVDVGRFLRLHQGLVEPPRRQRRSGPARGYRVRGFGGGRRRGRGRPGRPSRRRRPAAR